MPRLLVTSGGLVALPSAEERRRARSRRPTQRTRAIVFARDAYRCTECGEPARPGDPLEQHHDAAVRERPELAFDPRFSRTVHASCHAAVDQHARAERSAR